MDWISWVVLLAVIAGLIAAVRHLVKKKGTCSCSGNCSHCSGCGKKKG